jgi:hypothetical protein
VLTVDRVGNDLNDDDNAHGQNREGQNECKESVQDSHGVLLSDAGRRCDSCYEGSDGDIHLSDGQASQFLNPFSNVLTDFAVVSERMLATECSTRWKETSNCHRSRLSSSAAPLIGRPQS